MKLLSLLEETALDERTIDPEVLDPQATGERPQPPPIDVSPLSKMNFALTTIQEKRLYRENYRTFEYYCHQGWNLSCRRAKQIIDSGKVICNLNPGSPLPENEKQIRTLTFLPPEDQRIVWEMLIKEKNGKKPSGSEVAEAAKQHLKKPSSVKISMSVEDFKLLLRIAGKKDIDLLRELAGKFKESSPGYMIFTARISTIEKEGTDNG